MKTFVLGADDPEMRMTIECLEGAKLPFVFASLDGVRCHPGNAHRANGYIDASTKAVTRFTGNYANFVFVEARPFDVPLSKKYDRLTALDHHEEGDFGYAMPPASFWSASSLGQLVQLLNETGHRIAITQNMRVLAAMDHCRQAAIRGECPGVSAKEVIKRRVAEIAAAHATTPSHVQQKIDDFTVLLQERVLESFGDGKIVNFTDKHLGIGYSLDFLCAQTALDIAGLAALLRSNDSSSQSAQKIMLTGHVSPAMATYFMTAYAPAHKLVRVFGVPMRGYAGGYKPA